MFTGSQSMSPSVSGVIGALVTAAVMGLVALALYMLGGFRLRRAGEEERKRTFGGFKRDEKKYTLSTRNSKEHRARRFRRGDSSTIHERKTSGGKSQQSSF